MNHNLIKYAWSIRQVHAFKVSRDNQGHQNERIDWNAHRKS